MARSAGEGLDAGRGSGGATRGRRAPVARAPAARARPPPLLVDLAQPAEDSWRGPGRGGYPVSPMGQSETDRAAVPGEAIPTGLGSPERFGCQWNKYADLL